MRLSSSEVEPERTKSARATCVVPLYHHVHEVELLIFQVTCRMTYGE